MNALPVMSTQYDLLDWPKNRAVDLELMHPDAIFSADDPAIFTGLRENAFFDRKSCLIKPQDLAVELSSFGNATHAEGGVIAIGIADDKTIEGCSQLPEDRIAELKRMGCDSCPDGRFSVRNLPVVNSQGEKDFVILVRVHYVEDTLIEMTNGKVFIRDENRTRELRTDFEKEQIRMDKGEISFEKRKCGLSYPDDFNVPLVRKFLAKVREQNEIRSDMADEQILEMYHLGKREGGTIVPNNACALLFAKDPRNLFPGSYVHLIKYEGSDARGGREINVVKDRQYDGTIFDQIHNTAKALDGLLREFTRFSDAGQFLTAPEYPKDAWYELIVNACVHRSYHIRNAPIFLKIFDDEMRVESPGGFMPSVTAENIYEKHLPRNPVIMRVLREFGEVRCQSEGTTRVRREMQKLNLPDPIFKESKANQSSVRVTLKNDIINRKNSLDTEAYKEIGSMLALTLDDDDKKIVNYLMENQKITPTQVIRITSIKRWGTASEKLEDLRIRRILEKHEARKARGASWYYLKRGTDKEKGAKK